MLRDTNNVPSFCLMLVLGILFVLPAGNDEVAKDSEDLMTDFDVGSIANKLGGGTSSREILVTFRGISIHKEGLGSGEDLSNSDTTIHSGDVKIGGVRSNGFVTASNVERREGRLGALLE